MADSSGSSVEKKNGTEEGSGSNAAGSASASLSLTIRLSSGTRFEVAVVKPPSAAASSGENASAETLITVLDVKKALSEVEETSRCAVDRQRLIYKGRILEDARSLSDYGIVRGSTLFLVIAKGKTETPQNPSPASTARTGAAASSTTATARSVSVVDANSADIAIDRMFHRQQQEWQQQRQRLEQQMGAGAGAGGGGNDFLRDMIQQQMDNNPAMQELLRNNPSMQHLFNDPGAWEQAMQMMRNPAAMQQAMRQQDLALSQLENLPGGMAALQNMYNQYQQPLEDVFSQGSSSTQSTSATGVSGNNDAGASGRAMPNPWGGTTQQQPRTSARAPPQQQGGMPLQSPFSNMFGSPGAAPSNPWASPGMAPQRQGTSQQEREMMLQMLDNPAMMQMMQTAYQQNPGMFREMLMAQNPMLRTMFQNNPAGLDNWFQNMMNPNTMRAMIQMEDALRGMNLTPSNSGQPSGAPPAAGGLDFASLLQQQQQRPQMPPSMPDWNAMLGSLGGGGLPGMPTAASAAGWPGMPSVAPPTQQPAPADRYRRQLQSLYDMGFDDEVGNLAALQATSGNVNRAVDMLLSGGVPAAPAPAPIASSSAQATTVQASSAASESPAASASTDAAEETAPPQEKGPQEKKDD